MARSRRSSRPAAGRLSILKTGFSGLMQPVVRPRPDLDRIDGDGLRRHAEPLWEAQRAYLAERSSFYRRQVASADIRLKDVGDLGGLHRLPFATKAALRASQADTPPFGHHLACPPADVQSVYRSSGTTGDPLWIALTAADAATWTDVGLACYGTVGIGPRSRVLTTLGAGPYVAGHTHATLAAIGCRVIPVAPGDTGGALRVLGSALADTLLTTPSFALHLADRAGPAAADLGLRLVVTGAEPGGGLPAVRSRLEQAFGSRVAEVLGVAEVGPSLFGECAEGLGMHFTARAAVWLELVDESGEPLPMHMGDEGELVYTALVREAMPMVRFRSGDVARVVTHDCKCRRATPAFRVTGRRDDMFIVRGVNVFPGAVLDVVAGFGPATGRSRVVLPVGAVAVEAPVGVEVERLGAPAPDLADAVASAIRDRLGFRAEVRLVDPEEMGPPGYKTPAIRRV